MGTWPRSSARGIRVATPTWSWTTTRVAQRLPAVAAWLNEHLLCCDGLSTASLYESAALGRRAHRRIRVQRVGIEEAPRAFREAREGRAVVLSMPHRVTLSRMSACGGSGGDDGSGAAAGGRVTSV